MLLLNFFLVYFVIVFLKFGLVHRLVSVPILLLELFADLGVWVIYILDLFGHCMNLGRFCDSFHLQHFPHSRLNLDIILNSVLDITHHVILPAYFAIGYFLYFIPLFAINQGQLPNEVMNQLPDIL